MTTSWADTVKIQSFPEAGIWKVCWDTPKTTPLPKRFTNEPEAIAFAAKKRHSLRKYDSA